MQPINHVWRTVDQEMHLSLQHLRDWVVRGCTRERLADLTMLIATLAILTAVMLVLSRAAQNHTVEGISPYSSSLNWPSPVPGY
jgi:hypothetical protein